MNLKKIKKIHFVGIKGVAMTALAIVAKEMGIQVTGSDIEEKFPTVETLKRFNIHYHTHFSADNISSGTDLIIYTGAHQGINNIEVKAAIKQKILTLAHGKALGIFMQDKKGISVCGSHGKTTSSAMISHVLFKLGLDPSFAIGCGEISSLATPGHAGKGEYFVAEADEYVTDPTNDLTPRFLWQKPYRILISNIDFDHPDVYKNIKQVQEAFIKFTKNLNSGGKVILNIDDIYSQQILPKIKSSVITYGTKEMADFKLDDVLFKTGKTYFKLKNKGQIQQFVLKVPGMHNCLNAAGVIATLTSMGINSELIFNHLQTFIGTKRRFKLIANVNNKLFFDDYAHHPSEIGATLKGARLWFPNSRIVVVFQPHTFTRTKALLEEFSKSFSDADIVLLTDIYASAREKPIEGMNTQILVEKTRENHENVYFTPGKQAVLEYIGKKTKTGDIIISMGAGDIYSWIDEIKNVL